MVSFTRIAALAALLACLVAAAAGNRRAARAAGLYRYSMSGRKCQGKVKYSVQFYMAWTRERFGSTVPDGAVFSPLTAVTHSPRFSPWTRWGLARPPVETVAEGGQNMPLIQYLRSKPSQVGDVGFRTMPGPAKGANTVSLYADASRGFTHLSAIGMLFPTPDWLAFRNNLNLCAGGKWARYMHGPIFAYDAGTEVVTGTDQQPRQNIWRLQRPMFPRYDGVPVGWITIRMQY